PPARHAARQSRGGDRRTREDETMTSTTSDRLSFEVIPGNYTLPGNQPANYTLIKGRRDGLLVDVPFARSEAHRLIARILDSGRELRTIYINHDHPDPFFTLY